MRMILFFDLPINTKKDQKEYRDFIKLLKINGFSMMQESVYTKLALNHTVVDSTMHELKKKVPPLGNISVLTITEKQFSSIDILIGSFQSDVISSDDRLIKL